MKTFNEFIAEGVIEEAVSSDSVDRYKNENGGKGPAGHGNWYFSKHKSIDFKNHKEGEDHISVNGKYSDAKKQATAWAKEKGHGVIHLQT